MTVSSAVAIIGAATVLAIGGIGTAAVAGFARNPDDFSHIYGGLVLSMSGVIFAAVLAFAAAFFIK